MRIKKCLCGILACVLSLASTFVITPTLNASAFQISYKQGDVDGNGVTDTVDLIWTYKYLRGLYSSNRYNITRMDATEDGVIDYQDYNMILDFNMGHGTPQSCQSELYSAIPDERRHYYKYNYSNGHVTGTRSDYWLELPGTRKGNLNTSNKRATTIPTFVRDCSNVNTVRLQRDNAYNQSEFGGSGFIVNNHVVATAAHCVCTDSSTSDNITIRPGLKVRVYNYNESSYNEYNIDSIHIPVDYLTNTTKRNDNLDYALLHIDNEFDSNPTKKFSQYGLWNIGYMTSRFVNDNGTVTVSGFTNNPNNNTGVHRYYSTGSVCNDNYTTNLRFHAEAGSNNGDSGGPVYFNSGFNNTTFNSVVGNTTGGGYNAGYKFWGCRMIPAISRFYINNSNI